VLVHQAGATLEHPAYRRLTRTCARLAATSRTALPSQFRHPPAQLQTQHLATLCGHGEALGTEAFGIEALGDTRRADRGVASWTR
jgi:hypothetical protein